MVITVMRSPTPRRDEALSCRPSEDVNSFLLSCLRKVSQFVVKKVCLDGSLLRDDIVVAAPLFPFDAAESRSRLRIVRPEEQKKVSACR